MIVLCNDTQDDYMFECGLAWTEKINAYYSNSPIILYALTVVKMIKTVSSHNILGFYILNMIDD